MVFTTYAQLKAGFLKVFGFSLDAWQADRIGLAHPLETRICDWLDHHLDGLEAIAPGGFGKERGSVNDNDRLRAV